MKKLILFAFAIFITLSANAQLKIATTEDGRRVLLKDDNTWEYIDSEAKAETKKTSNFENCELEENFKEPEGDKKIQGFLKRIDATTEDLKKHVAVDNNCSVDDIKILNISEQKGNGNYLLCVKGKKMRYRRTGSVFNRQGEDPIGKY